MASITEVVIGYAVERIAVQPRSGVRVPESSRYSSRVAASEDARKLVDVIRWADRSVYPVYEDVRVADVIRYDVIDRDGRAVGEYARRADAEGVVSQVVAGYPAIDAYRALRARLVSMFAPRGEYTYPAVCADAGGLERIGATASRVWALAPGARSDLSAEYHAVALAATLPAEIEDTLWEMAAAPVSA